ncbi:hypothetical protein BC826DRAFT_1008737, partial [Russula brevipes]
MPRRISAPERHFSETQRTSSIHSQGRGSASDLGTRQRLRAAYRPPSCMTAIPVAKGTADSLKRVLSTSPL